MEKNNETEELIEKFAGNLLSDEQVGELNGGKRTWIISTGDGFGWFMGISGGKGEWGTTGQSCWDW
jgi:hypothetical protein